jgi:hypothetical protein
MPTPATAAKLAAIELCTWKECNKPASHRYRWEWGEENFVCQSCVPLMQQTAGNLQRNVSFVNLDQGPAPVTLSERTHLVAAKLSAEAELQQVQLNGHELYKSNVDLTQQVQTHVMQARERDALIRRKDEEIQELGERLQTREKDLGEAHAELQRLRTLVPFVDPPSVVGGRQNNPRRPGASRPPEGKTEPSETNPPKGD